MSSEHAKPLHLHKNVDWFGYFAPTYWKYECFLWVLSLNLFLNKLLYDIKSISNKMGGGGSRSIETKDSALFYCCFLQVDIK